jgi:hypothetical protein
MDDMYNTRTLLLYQSNQTVMELAAARQVERESVRKQQGKCRARA